MYINAYKSATLASEHPTQTEYRLFAEITRELELANEASTSNFDRVNAVFRNSQLWLALRMDLMSEDNNLNKDTKAGVISLAIWVAKYTTPAMKTGTDLRPLIDVNKQIMEGLSDAGKQARRPAVTQTVQPDFTQLSA